MYDSAPDSIVARLTRRDESENSITYCFILILIMIKEVVFILELMLPELYMMVFFIMIHGMMKHGMVYGKVK